MKKRNHKMLLGLVLALCLLGAVSALAAEVTVPPTITTDLPASLAVPVGNSFTLTIAASGEELSYQWYCNNAAIDGAVEPTYTVNSVTAANAGQYFCYVTNSLGGAESSSCTVTVAEPPVLTADINITSLTLTEGDTITLTASASGAGVVTEWYYVLNGTDIRPISGQTGNTLSVTAAPEYNGADIYCQFRNEAGAVTTSFCHVTVNTAPTPTPAPVPPTQTKPPYAETVEEGESATFIARADGATSYVWRFVSSSGTSYDYTAINGLFPGLRVSGGDTETLTLNSIPKELDGWSVRCLFKGEGGETLSDAAAITVRATAASITITKQPTGGTMALDENEDFVLSVQAASNSGGTLSYQWYTSPTNSSANMTAIAGATNSSYRPTRTEGTAYYRVGVSLSNNGVTSQPFYSYTVGVTFTPTKTHTHVYSDAWDHDGVSHWHQCTCGAHDAEAPHSYDWTIIMKPTADREGQQKGVCSVCGYETIQPIPAGSMPEEETATEVTREAKSGGHAWLFVLLGVLAAGVIGGAAYLIMRILRQDEDLSEDEYEEEDEEETGEENEDEKEFTKVFARLKDRR